MTEPQPDLLFDELGSSWWPLAWGPAFAVIGALLELITGPVHWLGWLLVALLLPLPTALWVWARRRVCTVRLTPRTLYQGRETLPVDTVAGVAEEIGEPLGARVLGGGFTVPRKFDGVPLTLQDGSTVVAWARDAEGLRAALHELVGT